MKHHQFQDLQYEPRTGEERDGRIAYGSGEEVSVDSVCNPFLFPINNIMPKNQKLEIQKQPQAWEFRMGTYKPSGVLVAVHSIAATSDPVPGSVIAKQITFSPLKQGPAT